MKPQRPERSEITHEPKSRHEAEVEHHIPRIRAVFNRWRKRQNCRESAFFQTGTPIQVS
jgi:hypothetical protein